MFVLSYFCSCLFDDVSFESVFVLRWSYVSELVLFYLERVTCVCWLVCFVHEVFGMFFKTFATPASNGALPLKRFDEDVSRFR